MVEVVLVAAWLLTLDSRQCDTEGETTSTKRVCLAAPKQPFAQLPPPTVPAHTLHLPLPPPPKRNLQPPNTQPTTHNSQVTAHQLLSSNFQAPVVMHPLATPAATAAALGMSLPPGFCLHSLLQGLGPQHSVPVMDVATQEVWPNMSMAEVGVGVDVCVAGAVVDETHTWPVVVVACLLLVV